MVLCEHHEVDDLEANIWNTRNGKAVDPISTWISSVTRKNKNTTKNM